MFIVVLAVVQDGDRFLLIEESKPRVRGTWNIPGGRLEDDESLVDATLREVREESGLLVTLGGLLYVDQLRSEGTDAPDRLRFVFSAVAHGGALKLEADEHSLRAAWLSRAELSTVKLRNALVPAMIELAASSAPLLPMTAFHVMSAEERERERAQSGLPPVQPPVR
jgi:ADP-ribose pyrophosphatase YjhB (NUDIX family)